MAVAFRAAGAWVFSASTSVGVTAVLPTGWQVGDIHVLTVVWKQKAATITNPTGWTLVSGTDVSSTTSVAYGAGVGDIRTTSFYRIAQSGDTSVVISALTGGATTTASGNVMGAQIEGFSNASGFWDVYGIATGESAQTNTTHAYGNLAGPAGTWSAGDMVVFGSGLSLSTPTISSPSVSSTGATISAVTATPGKGSSTIGADLLGWSGYASITAGSSTSTANFSHVSSAATYGTGSLVRIREFIPVAPNSATGLAVTPQSNSVSQLNLSWTAPSSVGSGITGYKIYRSVGTSTSDGSAGTFTLLTTTTGTGTTYNDTGLTASTGYSYYIVATTGADGPASNTASAYTNYTNNIAASDGGSLGTGSGTTSVSITTTAIIPANTIIIFLASASSTNTGGSMSYSSNNANLTVGFAPNIGYPAGAITNYGMMELFTNGANSIPAGTVIVFTPNIVTTDISAALHLITNGAYYSDPGAVSSFASTTSPTYQSVTSDTGLRIAGLVFNGATTTVTPTSGLTIVNSSSTAANNVRFMIGSMDSSASQFTNSSTLGVAKVGVSWATHVKSSVITAYSPPTSTTTPIRRIGKYTF